MTASRMPRQPDAPPEYLYDHMANGLRATGRIIAAPFRFAFALAHKVAFILVIAAGIRIALVLAGVWP
jgi:hypothetical protein